MASRASSSSRGTPSGAVDEDLFTKAFEDVPSVNVSSAREVNDKFSRIKDMLADGSQDWEKRIVALKEVRSLMLAGAADLIDIVAQVRLLDPGFQLSVRDLRSQVVREACITVAFLAMRLEHKFEFCAESLMPILVGLIQNSAKVMSTSGIIAIRFIVKNTHASRLIPTIVTHVSSKASIIRKQCLMFLDLLLNTWPRQTMERHVPILQEAIKKGLSDADADARMYSRRAFGCFAEHFREQAFTLLNSFDAAKQRQLLAELDNPSIFNDLKKTSRSKSTERTASSGPHSSWRPTPEPGGDGGVGVALSTPDLIPIQKPESTMRRNNSLRGGPSNTPSAYKIRKNSVTSVEQGHRSRTTSKVGISQSQPGSRSGSPSSRLVYVSTLQPDVASTSVKAPSMLSRPRPRRKTANSQGSSREGSPDRKLGQDFKAGVQSLRQASGRVSPSPRKASLTLQCMAEYGKDLETHITDALRQRRFRSDDGSDVASETSSVCSENSFRSGPDVPLSDDVAEVMALLLSGSWADRREGLVMLQRILRSERRLTHSELKRVTEVFTRMFHDPHSKVMSVFLEAFVDFVTAHSCDLTDWFPVCLTRLLAKAGSDVLGSMQSKITRALDALRDSFPHHHQFSCVTRFIVEQAQIPNVKVKLVLLIYLQGLICQMEPSCFSNNSDTRLAVSRVITWTSEPKSPEVRKAAQNVLIALMHLNSAELSVILSVLPKSFQEGASKVLSGVQLSPGDSAKIQASKTPFASHSTPGRVGMRSRSSIDSTDAAEVFNAEDVYNGIKKASEDIQHLSLLGRQLDLSLAVGKRNVLEQDDGITGDISVTSESIEEILVELSSSDNMLEQRLKALNQLMSIIKKCQSEEIWEKHFKMVLLLLLETMRDSSGKVRSSCLLALKELLDAQPERFRPYAELTILSLLEFEKDTDREVMRAAEDCGGALAKAISTEQSVSILNPISLTADFPINLAAIKLETKVVQAASESNVRTLMPDMIPGLIKGFENAESSVRKTSMLCLLSIYQLVGESLMSQLTTLHPSKMKLLNLYIKRTAEQKGRPGMTFEPVSPT